MKALTRRTFLTTSGTGLGLSRQPASAGMPWRRLTRILNHLELQWHAHLSGRLHLVQQRPQGAGSGSDPVTVGFTVDLFQRERHTVRGSRAVRHRQFSPSVDVATTVYCNGQWITTVPWSGMSGNVFLAACPSGADSRRLSWRHPRHHVAGNVLHHYARPEDSMAMGGGRLSQCEFRRRLQRPRCEAGGRQQGERLSQF